MGKVEIKKLEKDGAKAVVLKGTDSQGRPKQMAMTVYGAWTDLQVISSKDTNPDSENSMVIAASLKREKIFGYEPYIMISQVITQESLEDFKEDEIFSIEKITYTDKENCGGYGPVTLSMKDGREMTVDYLGIEGNLQI